MGRRHRNKRHRHRKSKTRSIPAENQMVLENVGSLPKDLTSYWRGSELVGMLDKSGDTLHIIGKYTKGCAESISVGGDTWSLAACGVYYKRRNSDMIHDGADQRLPCIECVEAVRTCREGPLFNVKLRNIMESVVARSVKAREPEVLSKRQSKKQRREQATTFRLNNRPPGDYFYPGSPIIITQYDFEPPYDYDGTTAKEAK